MLENSRISPPNQSDIQKLIMAGHTELIVRVAQTLSQAADRLSQLFADKNRAKK
jgi:hypothetical protein